MMQSVASTVSENHPPEQNASASVTLTANSTNDVTATVTSVEVFEPSGGEEVSFFLGLVYAV